MGGECNGLKIMDKAEVVYLAGTDGIDRIYPPKPYSSKILEALHQGGRQLDAVIKIAKIHYHRPKMKEDVKSHVSSCKICFTHKLSKSEAEQSGMKIPIQDLPPMNWLSTDLCEKKDFKGKKCAFIHCRRILMIC